MHKMRVLWIFASIVSLATSAKYASVETVFNKGVQAYTDERWTECIVQFEEAIHLYKMYKTMMNNCRLSCSNKQYDSAVKQNIDNLKFFEIIVNTGSCLMECVTKGFDELHLNNELSISMLEKMEAKKPYDYLHICFFQTYALQKAASAAYTYFLANPEDKTMKENLEYYMNQQEVHKNEIVDLDSEEYVALYDLGIKSYNQNNWVESAAAMEEVLSDYLLSENSCRATCESQTDEDWSPEFMITTARNIVSVLKCKQMCQNKLKYLNFNSGQDFLAEILNYLQILYYKLERIEDAAKAIESYLLINPLNEELNSNKEMYLTLTSKENFVVRTDILMYLQRDEYEKKIIGIFNAGIDKFDFESNTI